MARWAQTRRCVVVLTNVLTRVGWSPEKPLGGPSQQRNAFRAALGNGGVRVLPDLDFRINS